MRVSAIIPTYNRAHMIGKTIDSILNQSYPNMEVIIVDDGSTDNTEEVVRKYIHECTTIIRYYKKKNGGCASARNKGIDLASGECIAFLDSDDQWLPNAIDSMMKILLSSGADFVYSPTIQVINTINELIVYPAAAGRPEHFPREHFLTSQARPCALLYKRYIFDKLCFEERLRYNEDSDFLQKVALNFKAAYSPQPTAKVFFHETNKSGDRVSVFKALLSSSEKTLVDFPDFAKSLGETAKIRIREIKLLLIQELLNKNAVDEALSVSTEIRDHLQMGLRWSLFLGSSFPLKLSQTAKKITRSAGRFLHFFKNEKVDTSSLKVMHLFGTYLQIAENWGYRRIKNIPNAYSYIASEKADKVGPFMLHDCAFLLMPVVKWSQPSHAFIEKGMKLLRVLLRKLWLKLVIYFAGKSDIIHAHFSKLGWNYLWLAERKNIPMVVSYYKYDYEYASNHGPVWKRRYHEMFSSAALFVTGDNIGRSRLIKMGCPEEKVKVVNIGIETSAIPFYWRKKEPKELNLVQVGTFISKKSLVLMIPAFIQASRRCPRLTLTLVGKDRSGIRKVFQQMIRKNGLEGTIEWIDSIDFSRLHSFLKRFHVYFHPGKYSDQEDNRENTPVILLDVQATGMPVLSSFHHDSTNEVIHGETSLLVADNNNSGFAKAIETFYSMDEVSYRGYCERARRHVEENFDTIESALELKKTYESLIKSHCH